MPSLSEIIESYLRNLLSGAPGDVVEISRQEVAARFGCAPSQINYVLGTRFTTERGYLVESRRGGGGYIRIVRLSFRPTDLRTALQEEIGDQLTAREADDLLLRLAEAGVLDEAEAGLIKQAISRETRGVATPVSNVIRAMLLRTVLTVVLAVKGEG